MLPAKLLALIGVVVFAWACSMETSSGVTLSEVEESGEPTRYSLQEISPRVHDLDGRTVAVRGYLTGFGPILILVEYPDSNRYKSNAILVSDTELRLDILSGKQFYDLKRYFDSLGCVDRYADVVGEIGSIPEQGHNGIMRIETVTTFESSSFIGEGRVCYPPK